MRFILFLFAIPCFAQSFYGAYVSGLPQTAPHLTGGFFMAKPMSSSGNLYSYTKVEFSVSPDGKHLITTVEPICCAVKTTEKIGPCQIWAEALPGVATNGENTSFSLGGGGFAYCPVKKGFAVIPGFEATTSAVAGPQKRVEIGFSWSTSK